MRIVVSTWALLLASAVTLPSVQAETLEIVTVDSAGQPLPSRVLVRGHDDKCVVPVGAVILQTGEDTWFMSPGKCTVEVPAGDAQIRIERGPEFVRMKEQVRVSGSMSKSYQLERWIDMRKRGYLTGENHIHVDSVQLGPMLVAEGLDFGTSLTWWRGPDKLRPIPAGEGQTRLLKFGDRQVPTSIYDAELEYSWGAAYIQNLPSPLPIAAQPGRPNLDYLQHSVKAGAIVHYQGGWSREVLLDSLLGCVHTVNICNNNFALHRFQPRSRYSNLLEVPGFPVYPDTDEGMLKMNTDTYYRLLNCGLRLAAGGGSATGVKQAPVGYNRAYVQVEGITTLDEYYDAWKAGRNFVTNGPMLFLKAESGERPGDTIQFAKGSKTITLHVEAISDQTLTAVEVVANGKVVATLAIENERRAVGTCEVRVAEGTWIAARCTAKDGWLTDSELKRYQDKSGNTSFRVAPSRLRFAHTSPIYINVAERGAAVPKSIEEAFRMLDHFDQFAQKTADPLYQPAMKEAVRKARQKLKQLSN